MPDIEVDLDLLDVMLDLEPGALVWSPRQDATSDDPATLDRSLYHDRTEA